MTSPGGTVRSRGPYPLGRAPSSSGRAGDLRGALFHRALQVERAVERHPSVREVAVIGVPHPRWVESPVAVVVADGNEHPEQEEVLDFLKADLASYKKPRAVVYVDELPRNASGKILKRELRDSYWELFAKTVETE